MKNKIKREDGNMEKKRSLTVRILFLIITATVLTPTFVAILVFAHKKKYRRAQKLVKVAMFAGLVALLVCSF